MAVIKMPKETDYVLMSDVPSMVANALFPKSDKPCVLGPLSGEFGSNYFRNTEILKYRVLLDQLISDKKIVPVCLENKEIYLPITTFKHLCELWNIQVAIEILHNESPSKATVNNVIKSKKVIKGDTYKKREEEFSKLIESPLAIFEVDEEEDIYKLRVEDIFRFLKKGGNRMWDIKLDSYRSVLWNITLESFRSEFWFKYCRKYGIKMDSGAKPKKRLCSR